jgi:hypothetical protein
VERVVVREDLEEHPESLQRMHRRRQKERVTNP